MRKKLTMKQWKFANEYFNTICNASEAYRRVYNTARMKANTIHKRAYELRHHPLVAKEIAKIQQELRGKYGKHRW